MFKKLLKSKKQKVHLLHIGKTGGSAIKSILKDFPETDKFKIELHGHDTTVRDIPKGELIIFFLREPTSRFVSGFYSRKRKGQPRYYSEWSEEEKEVFEYYLTPNDMAQSLAKREERALKGMLYVQHLIRYNYWFGNFNYFKSRMNDILYIGFQESLDEDFKKIVDLLGISKELALPTDDIESHRNPEKLDKKISENGEAALKDWYLEDFIFIDLCKKIMKKNKRHF